MPVQKLKYSFFQPLAVLMLVLLAAGHAYSQIPEQGGGSVFLPRFITGINLYQEARWLDAAAELRAAQEAAGTSRDWAEALYWIVLTEIAASDYASALTDMDAMDRGAPKSGRNEDLVYHRARTYYYLGYYDDAITLFKKYADKAGPGGESRKTAAMYWIGECLFSMGQLDQAADCFTFVMNQYSGGFNKYESASYRLDLIKQKKIEIELLALLKWSHEESIRNDEEYQLREKTYTQALNAYQKRLADMMKDSRQAELENSNMEYQRQLAEARSRIQYLETQQGAGGSRPADEELRDQARRLREEIQQDRMNLEAQGGGYR